MLTPAWTSRSLASDLFDEMDRFFNASELAKAYDERSFAPATDVTETEDHYLMSLDVPGMKKEEIKIEVADNVLSVSGERKRVTAPDKKERVQRYEKSYGFFKRSFSLPNSIDAEKVEALYENGVLELYLPKVAQAKPRQIEVQSKLIHSSDKSS
jgi:HSP20 family protein